MSQTILPLACIYIYQYIYPISLGNFNILQPCCRKCLRDNRENLGKTRWSANLVVGISHTGSCLCWLRMKEISSYFLLLHLWSCWAIGSWWIDLSSRMSDCQIVEQWFQRRWHNPQVRWLIWPHPKDIERGARAISHPWHHCDDFSTKILLHRSPMKLHRIHLTAAHLCQAPRQVFILMLWQSNTCSGARFLWSSGWISQLVVFAQDPAYATGPHDFVCSSPAG